MKYTVEIIAFTIESCVVIEQSGADRIELCDNPSDGGTTASYGLIKAAREKVTIPLFPIIRPRGGDFLYSDDEFSIMKTDVRLCKELGCDGVVVGLLHKDGRIDVERTAQLVELAHPMDVTFHRAFDHCYDPFEALEQIIQIGCKRILTSGQKPLATEGAERIAELVKAADGRIVIMPGSGVRPVNIGELAKQTGAMEFHASLRSNARSKMEFRHPAFAGTDQGDSYMTTEASAIKSLLHALNG
ncbi:copper homeostasis protein CutC [Flavisolibacter nicotianae]|uniref:copper homeostasis protein CutC n=1 Tax=Flavisolibacter nicotianae TaxID=2364882 RepID=UPI000EB575F6|nr:copper homeostasis protein CutC [Flavisolibacter nicotianae]